MSLRRDTPPTVWLAECLTMWKRLSWFIQSARIFYRRWWHRVFPVKRGSLDIFGTLPDEVTCRICEYLETNELGRIGCGRRLRRIITAPTWDQMLWRPACARSWKSRQYDPLVVLDLASQSWRDRYFLALRDAQRTVASAFDVQSVKAWRVRDLTEKCTYDIDEWPYRVNGLYVSPTFGIKAYVLKRTHIQVSGLPRIKIVRNPTTWGWSLVNPNLVLDSIVHLPQPPRLPVLLPMSSPRRRHHDSDVITTSLRR